MGADTESQRYGEELFHLLVETVEDYAIFAMDPAGRIVHWNAGAARVTGFAADEVTGRTLAAIFTPDDVAAGVPELELRTAAETGRAEDERWHLRKDGSRFWAFGVVAPLRAADGTLRGFGKLMRDRTDQKELQDALRGRAEALLGADERKNVFLATLAHELRNPLAPLANAAHLLRLPGTRPADLPALADVIDRQVRQLRRLVDDLIDVARVQRGKVELDRQRVRLGAVVEQAVETTRPLVEARRHRLAVVVPPVPVELDADPGRLVQVFVNLLSNAAKFTDPGGEVAVTVGVEDAEAVVRVRDTGDGIAPEDQARVFELFVQAPTTRSGGLGIGLALVRDLVSLHGGTVQARSDGVGKGSEFIVRLPLAAG